jgi:hypothetical protein
MRLGAIVVAAALAVAGCGGGSDHHGPAGTTVGTAAPPTVGQAAVTGKLPPGAVGPTDTVEEQAEGPAATEASPEASASGPASKGELTSGDRSAVGRAVDVYISALDRHNAARLCGLFAPGALDLAVLPTRRGGCRPSLRASIGTRPRSRGPAWRRTVLVDVKTEDLGDGRARVSATVTHRFSDRKYVSVEDDVIYLEKLGDRWLLAKPSATLYRAVGYAQPPLRAFSPPAGW